MRSSEPASASIQRAHTNSASDSRFSQRTPYSGIGSPRERSSVSRSFGAPAHRARDVQCAPAGDPPGSDERGQRRQFVLRFVDRAFQRRHVVGAHFGTIPSPYGSGVARALPRLKSTSCVHASHASSGSRSRVVAAAAPPARRRRARELVHGAVRLDAQRMLGDARAADQAGRAVVSGARVNARAFRHPASLRRTTARSPPAGRPRRQTLETWPLMSQAPAKPSSRRFLRRRPIFPPGTPPSV